MQRIWARPAQVAAWLAGMVLLFVVEPPRLSVDETPPSLERFIQFALAIICGIVFAFFSLRPPRDPRPPALVSLALLILGIGLFGTYLYLLDAWTCAYPGGALITGLEMLPAATQYMADNPGLDCRQLVLDFAGQTEMIWPADELSRRRLFLVAVFTGVVIVFSLAALFMIRALSTEHRASGKKGTGRRKRARAKGVDTASE